jgi:hypothetical protein
MRTALALVVLLGVAPACSTPVKEEPPAPRAGQAAAQVPDTLPPSLRKRLAEAIDGYRDGQQRWIVADRNFRIDGHGHKVVRPLFLDPDAAAAARDSAAARDTTKADFGVFGPFRATEDPAQVIDTTEDVMEVIVVTRGKTKKPDGTIKPDTTKYNGREFDALFWSMPAFDKFVVPYLDSVGGAEFAKRQRELYRLNMSPFAGSQSVPHYRGSL